MSEAERAETPDETIPRDPGIPVADERDALIPDERDPSTADREALDDPDREGHMGAGSS